MMKCNKYNVNDSLNKLRNLNTDKTNKQLFIRNQ